MSTNLNWRGVRYLIPDNADARYVILPSSPNGSDVQVLERTSRNSFKACYVPKSNGSLTTIEAQHLFYGAVIATRTDTRIINPRIGQ